MYTGALKSINPVHLKRNVKTETKAKENAKVALISYMLF